MHVLCTLLQICVAEGDKVLTCVSPSFPSPFPAVTGNTVKRSRGEVIVNYTLELDGAPGPNISSEMLALFLKPNPVVFEINNADRVYVPGKSISISVSRIFYISARE